MYEPGSSKTMGKVKREATRVGISKSLGRVDSPLASLSRSNGSNLGGASSWSYASSTGRSHLRAVVEPDMTRAWSVETLAPPPGMVTTGRPLGKRRLLGKPNSMEGSWQVRELSFVLRYQLTKPRKLSVVIGFFVFFVFVLAFAAPCW